MTGQEFANKCLEVLKYKTVYASGTFGQCATDGNINNKAKQYPKWYTKARVNMLKSLPDDTRMFDCCGLIKGVYWGFPNTVYTSNGLKDVNDQRLWEMCEQSRDFSNIQVGELLWLQGHVGLYIGDGKGIECTSQWANKVQITAVGNIGAISGLKTRKWTGHGKLPFISYEQKEEPKPEPKPEPEIKPVQKVYYVKKGDTLTSIAKAHGMSLAKLISYNPQIRDINKISIGQVIYLSADTIEEFYTVKKGDTLGSIARQFNMSLNKLLGLNPDIKNPNLIHVGDKIRIK